MGILTKVNGCVFRLDIVIDERHGQDNGRGRSDPEQNLRRSQQDKGPDVFVQIFGRVNFALLLERVRLLRGETHFLVEAHAGIRVHDDTVNVPFRSEELGRCKSQHGQSDGEQSGGQPAGSMAAAAKMRHKKHDGNVGDVVDGGDDARGLAGNLEAFLDGRQCPVTNKKTIFLNNKIFIWNNKNKIKKKI